MNDTGDDAQIWESVHGPFGPYQIHNDIINCSNTNHRGYPGQGVTSNLTCGGPGPSGPGPEQQCQRDAPERGPGAQQFGVFHIPSSGMNATTYLYVGIRYGSAPDGMKCHEYQYWDELTFDEDGHALPMRFRPEVTLNLTTSDRIEDGIDMSRIDKVMKEEIEQREDDQVKTAIDDTTLRRSLLYP